ncbi:hypothetical protein [Nitratifractor salsuginis]|uniref:Uncharacterized protein n=1 Tax=Nitratifractor salsuginis (strain DSM 16511 / JCM 12458 / E9I37-1) TaxID=749222 RepID=E6X1U1_NITSE|nr:hypothetical protein [Nitratifractor salsuginis]ADV45949.1 hypothetical protein Nitsa_0681 [Nitratifractor salsuginis DSM 16511]
MKMTLKYATVLLLSGTLSSLNAAPSCLEVWGSGLEAGSDNSTAFDFDTNSPIPRLYDWVNCRLIGKDKSGDMECRDSNNNIVANVDVTGYERTTISDSTPGGEDLVVNENETLTLTPGQTYDYNSIQVSEGGKILVGSGNGVVYIRVSGDVKLDKNAFINCSSYPGNDGDTNGFGDPQKLVIYTNGQFQFGGEQACISGFVYAKGKIDFNDDARVMGSVSADYFDNVKSGTEIHERQPSGDFSPLCEPGAAAEDGWHFVGIPADTSADSATVDDIFGDNFGTLRYSTSGPGWTLYRRDFSTTDNSSSYTTMDINDTLETGRGYWLYTDTKRIWDVERASPINWNIAKGTDGCQSDNGCIEYRLPVPVQDCATAPASDRFRNVMVGYPGKSNADWKDYRFLLDGSTVYTPSEAETAGYALKKIHQYDRAADDYTTCDDTDQTPGACVTKPWEGIWVQVECGTAGHTLDLVIPNGGAQQ